MASEAPTMPLGVVETNTTLTILLCSNPGKVKMLSDGSKGSAFPSMVMEWTAYPLSGATFKSISGISVTSIANDPLGNTTDSHFRSGTFTVMRQVAEMLPRQ